jgi:hypothetical protein
MKSRVTGVTVGPVSVELSAAIELSAKWPQYDTNVNRLTSSKVFDSATKSLFDQIETAGHADYSVIDLGDGERWLTSRLYAFAVILGQMQRARVFVFVHQKGDNPMALVGITRPEQIRGRLSQSYPWLETAFLKARAEDLAGSADPTTAVDIAEIGETDSSRLSQIVENYIDTLQSPPQAMPAATDDWLQLQDTSTGQSVWEHTNWISAAALEELMGESLKRQHYKEDPDEGSEAAAAKVLRRKGDFVAVLDDRDRFTRLIDRAALLEDLAPRQAARLSV